MRHKQRGWHSSGHDLYPCPERMAASPRRMALGGHCLGNISAARVRLWECPAAPVQDGVRALGLGHLDWDTAAPVKDGVRTLGLGHWDWDTLLENGLRTLGLGHWDWDTAAPVQDGLRTLGHSLGEWA